MIIKVEINEQTIGAVNLISEVCDVLSLDFAEMGDFEQGTFWEELSLLFRINVKNYQDKVKVIDLPDEIIPKVTSLLRGRLSLTEEVTTFIPNHKQLNQEEIALLHFFEKLEYGCGCDLTLV